MPFLWGWWVIEDLGYLFVQGVVVTLKPASITSCRETAREEGAHVVRILPGVRTCAPPRRPETLRPDGR